MYPLKPLGLSSLLIVASAQVALAATAQFTTLGVDELAVSFYQSLLQVWIPLIAAGAIILLVINICGGFYNVGPRVVGTVFGLAILGLGMPRIAQIFGTGIATGIILP